MTGPMRFLLVHSPLVGPGTLHPLAEELAARGHSATTPDLRGVVDDPRPAWLIGRIVSDSAHDGVDVAVAHSGAGAILPTVADRVGARAAVFLDAVLPQVGAEEHVAPAGQRTLLAEHVDEEGILRPWLTWWPDEVVAQLLPDPQQRAALTAEQPRLPVSFYDEQVQLPTTWVPSAFVALGGAYRDELETARGHGWPTRSLQLTHLATVTSPVQTADAVLSVVAELEGH